MCKKHLFTAFLLFSMFAGHAQATYRPGTHVVVNDAVAPTPAVPLDARTMKYDSINFLYRAYNGTAEVLTYLNTANYRSGNFIVVVDSGGSLQSNGTYVGGYNTFWMFKDSTTAGGLVKMNLFGMGAGVCATCLQAANNLSDLASLSTALVNLGLNNVNNTSDATKNAATVTLTNHTISGAANTFTNIPNSSLSNSSIGLTLNSTGTTPQVTATPAALGTSLVMTIPWTNGTDSGFLKGTDWAFFDGKLDSVHVSNDTVYNCVNGTCSFQSVISGTGGVNTVNPANTSLLFSPTTGNVLGQVNPAWNANWSGQHTFVSFAPIFSTLPTPGGIFYGSNSSGQLAQSAAGTNGQIFESTGGTAPIFFTPVAATIEGWLGYTPLSASLPSTQIYVGNSMNTAQAVNMSGDVAINNVGVTAIQPNVVSNSDLAQMPATTIKGNNTGITANAADLTATQVTAMLNLFTSSTQGLVPAPGAAPSTNVLDAAGNWVVPSGGTVTAENSISGNGSGGSPLQLVGDITTPKRFRFYGTRIIDSARSYQEIEENFYGILYNNSFFTSASTGWVNRNCTVSLSGNRLNFSGGNGSLECLQINNGVLGPSMLDKWFMAAKVGVTSKNSTATEGFGIGKFSTNTYHAAYAYSKFFANSGVNSGQIALYGGTDSVQMAISTGALTFSIGDSILTWIQRDGYTITAYAQDITTNSIIISCTYTYITNPIADPVMDNTGQYAFYTFGGTQTLDSLVVISQTPVNARFGWQTDSKGQGYGATYQGYRFLDQLNGYVRSTVNHCGGYDRTVEASQGAYEVIALKPQQWMLGPFSNDPRSGISSAVTIARYDSLSAAYIAAGIDVYYALSFHEGTGGTNQSPLDAHILATYPASKIINYTTVTSIPGALYSDSIHLSNLGDSLVAQTTLNAVNRIYGRNQRYGNPGINLTGLAGTNNTLAMFSTPGLLVNSPLSYNGSNRVTSTQAVETDVAYSQDFLAGGTDAKIWNQYTSANTLNYSTVPDARSGNNNYATVTRSGANATGASYLIPLTLNPGTGGTNLILTGQASQPLIFSNTSVTGFINVLDISAAVTAGMGSLQSNSSTTSTAYSNFTTASSVTSGGTGDPSFSVKRGSSNYWTMRQDVNNNFLIGPTVFFSAETTPALVINHTSLNTMFGGTTTDNAGFVQTSANTATNASMFFNGAAVDVTSPTNGMVWYNSTAHTFNFRDNGTTYNLLSPAIPTLQQVINAGATLTGTNTIAIGSGTLSITGSTGTLAVAPTISTGLVISTHLQGNAPSAQPPSIAAGAGAGSSPTVSLTGGDQSGIINVTTGTLPTAGATVVTVTYHGAYSNGSYPVLMPANAATALLSAATMVYTTGTPTTLVITAGTTGLGAATAYAWYYYVGAD